MNKRREKEEKRRKEITYRRLNFIFLIRIVKSTLWIEKIQNNNDSNYYSTFDTVFNRLIIINKNVRIYSNGLWLSWLSYIRIDTLRSMSIIDSISNQWWITVRSSGIDECNEYGRHEDNGWQTNIEYASTIPKATVP